jgi:hypothetical protein
LSIVGRRGSSGSGWSWSRPPTGPRRQPPGRSLLPFAGFGLAGLLVVLALLGLWLSDDDDERPAGASGTPTATAAVTATSAPPPLSPTPTPPAGSPLFSLAAWDGARWRFEPRLAGASYREGEAVPFLLRVDDAVPGAVYALTVRYDCRAFDFLTSYDRDEGGAPALAAGGLGRALADSALAVPDDPATPADDGEGGSFSLWGGLFTDEAGILPASPCSGEKSVGISVSAAAETLFLAWGSHLSKAAAGGAPPRLTVGLPGGEELSVEIDPDSVRPSGP